MTDNRPITIRPLTSQERADDYPYAAPPTGYVITDGKYRATACDEVPDLTGRIALLSVGSNRSPQQLLRKFGPEAVLPVTTALLKNCDIIHSACFSYYGAVPCSAAPSTGTDIMVNAVWLTPEQLQIMHDTEAVGIAYDYCRWDEGSVEIVGAPQPEAVFGYATRLGYLADQNGAPYALSYLHAERRHFTALSQDQARTKLYAMLPAGLKADDKVAFMARLTSDKGYRLAVNEALGAQGTVITSGPWQIIPATPKDADSFL